MEERVQKIIANIGIYSRREAEDLIKDGAVRVNDKIIKIGDKADKYKDEIFVIGHKIVIDKEKYYYILNKPKGLLVTKDDPKKRKTIYQLHSLKHLKHKIGYDLNHVGRLDGLSEGIILLTNDGKLANKLMHPRNHISKTYQIRTEPKISIEDREKIEKGLMIDNQKFFGKFRNIKENTFEIEIKEGRNRILRRVFQEKLNYKIFLLKRISIDEIKLGNLETGQIRKLSKEEINCLYEITK